MNLSIRNESATAFQNSILHARTSRGVDAALRYQRYREDLGRAILVGLEVLVAADIVRSVALDPTLAGVGVLALLVVVRTFLSWSLSVELEGEWPWQRGKRS